MVCLQILQALEFDRDLQMGKESALRTASAVVQIEGMRDMGAYARDDQQDMKLKTEF